MPPASDRSAAAPTAVVRLDDVTKQFGATTAVDHVSLHIQSGEIFGIVGPSGCGKTSTIRMITGVYIPDSGTVDVLGLNPQQFRPRHREQIGYMPQLFALYPNLTVLENLRFAASMYGLPWYGRGTRLRQALDFVELTKAKHTLAENISGGMQRRLQLAASLIHNPALIIADEPTAGIDPVLRGRFWDQFKTLRDQSKTLIITTQYVSEVAYCDRVAVMRNSKVLMIDTPEGLRQRAVGGEIISLRVDPEDVWNAMMLLKRQPFVKDVRRMRHTVPGSLEIFVDNASATMPEVIQALATDASIDMRQAEEYKPPFDEIFITLMEQAEQAEAQQQEAA